MSRRESSAATAIRRDAARTVVRDARAAIERALCLGGTVIRVEIRGVDDASAARRADAVFSSHDAQAAVFCDETLRGRAGAVAADFAAFAETGDLRKHALRATKSADRVDLRLSASSLASTAENAARGDDGAACDGLAVRNRAAPPSSSSSPSRPAKRARAPRRPSDAGSRAQQHQRRSPSAPTTEIGSSSRALVPTTTTTTMTIDDGGGGTEEDWRDGGAWTAWRAVATRRAGCFARPLAPPLEESRSVGVTARRVGEVLRAAASMARPRLALTLRAGLPGALMAFDGDEEAARREPTWCDVAVSASRLRVLSRGLGSHALTARGWRGVGALVLDWREEGSSGDRVTLTLFDA